MSRIVLLGPVHRGTQFCAEIDEAMALTIIDGESWEASREPREGELADAAVLVRRRPWPVLDAMKEEEAYATLYGFALFLGTVKGARQFQFAVPAGGS